jgi:hypothetical protein
VDRAATDAARHVETREGQLPVDNLREAAWMMLLAPHAQAEVLTKAWSYPIPPGVAVQSSRVDSRIITVRVGGAYSSGQTVIDWKYVRSGHVSGHGTLTWPDAPGAAEDHAVNLLQIAELGLREGCPQAAIPLQLIRGEIGGEPSFADLLAELAKVRCGR